MTPTIGYLIVALVTLVVSALVDPNEEGVSQEANFLAHGLVALVWPAMLLYCVYAVIRGIRKRMGKRT